MSLLFAFSLAWADPPPKAAPEPSRDEVRETERASKELSRRLARGRDHLDRTALCIELVPLADRVRPETLAELVAACPSWFPVPAPPSFCRIDPCVTDATYRDASDRTAAVPRPVDDGASRRSEP